MSAPLRISREALDLIDTGNDALGRNDRRIAARSYAHASEILCQEGLRCADLAAKRDLERRAAELLRTAQALTGSIGKRAGAQSGIRFDDVAGLEEVKDSLRLRVIYPRKHPEKVAKYGVRAGGGVLLFGPPGTGKTMIAKAIAGELEMPFLTVKPSEVLSKYVGESEQKLAELFTEARRHNQGAVIFIDEIDAIGASREKTDHEGSRRLVTQLLQELDGVQGRDHGLLFLAATNEPWLLDEALLRPGRFDDKCYVTLPDEVARRELLRLQLRGVQLANDLDFGMLARTTEGYSGADLMCLCERAKQIPFREAVLHGTDRSLTAADLKRAAADVRPSVSAERLKRYEEYAAV